MLKDTHINSNATPNSTMELKLVNYKQLNCSDFKRFKQIIAFFLSLDIFSAGTGEDCFCGWLIHFHIIKKNYKSFIGVFSKFNRKWKNLNNLNEVEISQKHESKLLSKNTNKVSQMKQAHCSQNGQSNGVCKFPNRISFMIGMFSIYDTYDNLIQTELT